MADQQTQAQEPPLPTTLKSAKLGLPPEGRHFLPLCGASLSQPHSLPRLPNHLNGIFFARTNFFSIFLVCQCTVSIPFSVCIVHQISQQHSHHSAGRPRWKTGGDECFSRRTSHAAIVFSLYSMSLFLFTYAGTQVLSTFHQSPFFLLLSFDVSYDGGITGRFSQSFEGSRLFFIYFLVC
jgi:hypothetical protein